MYQEIIYNEFSNIEEAWSIFISNKMHIESINHAAEIIVNAFLNGKKVLTCGNGGSHCNAMHFAEELTGRYRDERPAYPAIVISDPSLISCIGNDFGFEYIFSRYIEALGQEHDVLLSISTSGKSPNILHAIDTAHVKRMKIINLIGFNKTNYYSDVEINVQHFGYADRIQEIHMKIIHILVLLIEKKCSNFYNK